MLKDSYPEYGNFKRRIINPAIKELNKNGFFEITISENKSGRKVESIDFIIIVLKNKLVALEQGFDEKDEVIENSNFDLKEALDQMGTIMLQ